MRFSLSIDILSAQKRAKLLLPPDTFPCLKIYYKCICGRDALGKLTGGEEEGGGRKVEGQGKGGEEKKRKRRGRGGDWKKGKR